MAIRFDGKTYATPDDVYLDGFHAGKDSVIRCRDCFYWIDEDFCNNPQWHVSHPACERPCTEPNGFCSWAERRQA